MGGARKDGIYLQLQCKFMLALFAGFHGVENWVPWRGKTAKMASMAWKFSGKWLPWRGKTAKPGSMAWKEG